MSEIRNLLSSAQEAEMRGEKAEAVRLLRKAAEYYRDRQLLKKAAQMLRQARRVEGIADEPTDAVFGFGSEFEADAVPEVARPRPDRELVEQRGPQLADPALEAWCSFCCQPKAVVGPLVAGPAGAYACAACLRQSAQLMPGAEVVVAAAPEVWSLTALAHELPAQRRARDRFMRLRPRLALVIGPEGTGKTTWLSSLRGPDVREVEVTSRLSADDERALLDWLAVPSRSAFLVVRAAVPTPALVLQGEHGDEPVHDTATLAAAVPHVSPTLLARVDAVHAFEPPSELALFDLATALARTRRVSLPEAALIQLVSLALRAQRGAHELATLIARIPPGTYNP